MTCRRLLGATAATIALLFLAGATADAGRLVTWKTESKFVDPALVEFGRDPICAKCAPHPGDGLYVNVWLPAGYDGRRRFPVLYLLHGGDGQYDFWLHSPRDDDPRGPIVPDLVSDFPGIIVMPDAGADGHYANWWSRGRRGGPDWEQYHLDELIPVVERRLRVRRGRRFRAVAGFSMGGYGAAYYATQRPGYFGIVAAMSARLSLRDPILYGPLDYVFGDPSRQDFYWAGHDPVRLVRNLQWTRVYISVGDARAIDGEPSGPQNVEGERNLGRFTRRFRAVARQAGVPLRFRLIPGAHNYDLGWRSFAAALPWIANSFGRPLPERPPSWTYSTVARTSEAFGYRFSFGTAPRAVTTFSFDRGVLRGRGRGTVTVRAPSGAVRRTRLPLMLRTR